MSASSSLHPSMANVRSEPIVVIGAGIAGLIHAYVLLCDGFTNVTIITRDPTVGGVWSKDRIYPGLKVNSPRREYRFSQLDLLPRQDADEPLPPGEEARVTGDELCVYFEKFYKEFIVYRFGEALTTRFETEVLKIRREAVGKWVVHCVNAKGQEELLRFSKLILATGVTSQPVIPPSLRPDVAKKSGYNGAVFHSSEYGKRYREILAAVPPANLKANTKTDLSSGKNHDDDDEDEDKFVLIAGCGKSAKDISMHLANQGRKVCLVFRQGSTFVAGPSPPPMWLLKSRLITVLMPFSSLNSRLERFLHNTRLGSWLVRKTWGMIDSMSIQSTGLPLKHPLHPPRPLFYSAPDSNEGVIRPGSFYAHAREGTILRTIAPAKLVEFTQGSGNGSGVRLDNGRVLRPSAVVLCTGYNNSYTRLFDDELIRELGLEKVPFAPSAERQEEFRKKWNYHTLKDAPPFSPPESGEDLMLTVHRGIVPVQNLPNRDFAIAGALFASHLCYATEAAAHWVSSYFLSDPFLSLPTQEEALRVAEEKAAWSRKRYPESYNIMFGAGTPAPALDAFNWTQTTEELLSDLGVEERKSRKGIFWAFGQISVDELGTLGDERKLLRERYNGAS